MGRWAALALITSVAIILGCVVVNAAVQMWATPK
jgi:hypothetical protein